MCCRLRLDLRELRKKSGGFFGSGESTGSVGVVTINMPRIAYQARDRADFYKRLDHVMDLAARSLKVKRTVITKLLNEGLYPYTKRYLGTFANHFSTIGLIGMPIGDTIRFPESSYIPCSVVLEKVPRLVPVGQTGDGVARLYRLPDGKGRVGLISPLSDEFCDTCSRLRLTADGCLKPCLHSAEEIHLRGLHGSELTWALKLAIAHKPKQHGTLSATERSGSRRDMYFSTATW